MLTEMASQLDDVMPTALTGSVVQTIGMTAAVASFPAPVGALVEIERQTGRPVPAEVVGFRDRLTIVYPLGDLSGVRHGSRVRLVRTSRTVRVGPEPRSRHACARGRSMNSWGSPPWWEKELLCAS